jgi:hypothetical protein
MRLYTGNRRGANEHRGFFLPLKKRSFVTVLPVFKESKHFFGPNPCAALNKILNCASF